MENNKNYLQVFGIKPMLCFSMALLTADVISEACNISYSRKEYKLY